MGGRRRGKNRKKKKEKVTEEQGAKKESEMDILELFDWYMSGKRPEQEDDDLYDRCAFLIRAVNSKIIPTVIPPRRCDQEDFHSINLVTNSTFSSYFPSIVNCVDHGTMLSFHTRQAFQIYILAEQSAPPVEHTHDVDQPNNEHEHQHTGASVISATQVEEDWKPFVHPDTHQNRNTLNLNPAVLSDQIYTFGFPILCPRVCYPNTSKNWDCITLPEHLVETKVSFPLFSDPLNDRIIMNLPKKYMLYAFYPTTGKWEPLARFVARWDYIAAAIADDIIFFVPADVCGIHDFIVAFDLKTSTWLDIEWDFRDIRGFVIVYQAIFTLSNKGLMCLATGIRGSSVQFLRFRVKRTSDTTLKLIALDYQKYDLPDATRISDIIFLRNPSF